MDCREINFFDDSIEVVEKDVGPKEMKVETAKPNTFGREEPAIEIFTPAVNVGTFTSNSNEAAGGPILACCSGGLFDDLSDDEMNIDQSPTGGKTAKGSDDDEKTVDTSQLDSARDSSSSSCASGRNTNNDKDDNVDNSNTDAEESVSYKSNCVSSLQNLMTNLISKANELDELDTFLVSWHLKSSSSSTNGSTSKNNDDKDDVADNNAPKSEDSVIRRRSYVASLHDLTTNQSQKSTQLDELDKYLVSWQSRQSACEPSDSRNYNESVEITALNTPPPQRGNCQSHITKVDITPPPS